MVLNVVVAAVIVIMVATVLVVEIVALVVVLVVMVVVVIVVIVVAVQYLSGGSSNRIGPGMWQSRCANLATGMRIADSMHLGRCACL